jgi:hypothetical protein
MNFEKLDRARIAAALVAAILTGGAALYGVYSKSREATAASYETLAPEINELKSNVEELRAENGRLRDALTRATGVRVAAGEPPSTEGRAAPRRARRASAPGPAPGAATPADAGATATAPPPTEQPPPVPPPGEQPPPADDPIEDIKKRVPIDFEKAVRVWKDVQDIRKRLPEK